MKNIYKIFLLSILVFAVSCENEDDPRFQDSPETGWIEFQSSSTTVAVTPRSATVNIPVTFTAPINLSDVTVTYSVQAVVGTSVGVIEDIGTSITIVGNTNRNNIELEFVDGAVDNLIANGDVEFDITLTAATRGIGVGLADNSATVTHRVNLLCGGEPQPGVYTVDMHDSWGDGWQTVGDSGPGMTVTLLDVNGDETVIEFGMCSTYGTPTGAFLDAGSCTPGDGFDGTVGITFPAGTIDATWSFPGDRFGEISFEIYTPSGNLLYASGGPGDQAEGDITSISYCI